MKLTRKQRGLHAVLCLLLLLVFLFPYTVKMQNDGGMSALTASANGYYDVYEDYNAEIEVEQYDVRMCVHKDRKIDVYEKIRVRFVDNDLTMFYRSLPTDGARYEDVEARCEGNDEFYFYIADNEEGGAFIDINCVGNAHMGTAWTYEITYVMEQGANTVKDGMIMDVVGFGWMVPLNNVSVQIEFPEKPLFTEVHTDVFGVENANEVTKTWISDTVLWLGAKRLDLVYSEKYDEVVTGAITLEFTLSEGVLDGYHGTRLFTADIGKILVAVVIAIGLSVAIAVLVGHKREMITVVNISPPKGMDPMKMGKWIDGSVNNEDITSMIYYFANKGYLTIDFSDENDPMLVTAHDKLPETATAYEKTLFNALFDGAMAWQGEKAAIEGVPRRCVKVSELTGKFYEASRIATKQVPDVPPMYEGKSIFAYVAGSVLGLIIAILLPLIISRRIGGGYYYMLGVTFLFPLGANAAIGYFIENYRYKWKAKKRNALLLVEVLIAFAFSLMFVAAMAEHVLTGYEKALLSIGIFGSAFITSGKLSRSEEYLKELEDILGFKEFITVTEEDKIKVM
ncbi:MAG: DUF2207 domain-containing protein [Clostridia bacterium]|nr:DUF2207 domain-containing protein [Clostridia bacterium]